MKKLLIMFCVIFLFSGCSMISRITRGATRNIAGTSISALERVKDGVQSSVFDCGVDDCFQKVLTFVKGKMEGVQVLRIDRQAPALLLLVSRPTLEEIEGDFAANVADTAVFFIKEGVNKTRIEISSLSSLFAEYTADKIFSELRPPPPKAAQPANFGIDDIDNIDEEGFTQELQEPEEEGQ